jgi:hypothetical protein
LLSYWYYDFLNNVAPIAAGSDRKGTANHIFFRNYPLYHVVSTLAASSLAVKFREWHALGFDSGYAVV